MKLLPTPEQASVLTATLDSCNAAATWVSGQVYERGLRSAFDIQKVTYGQAKFRFGLSAQPTVRVIKNVANAYTTLRANLRAGNYGKPGSPRRARVEGKPIRFRADSAQPFDDRCLSWQHPDRTVSIWTVAGRMKGLAYTGRAQDLELLAARRWGQSDLVTRAGMWFLYATVDLPDVTPDAPVNGFIGVDLGIVAIASTHHPVSGAHADWSGGAVTARRRKNAALRRKLQAKGTKSAKRLLRKRSGKESRFIADVNHQISTRIVAEGKRTGCGIAVEDLTGIRNRVRFRKPQRAAVHSWAFAQLGQFLAYKASRVGVVFVQIDPAYTSQTCSRCGHTDEKNRPSQAEFKCRSCGFSLGADHNAAVNIGRRGQDHYTAAVNLPNAA